MKKIFKNAVIYTSLFLLASTVISCYSAGQYIPGLAISREDLGVFSLGSSRVGYVKLTNNSSGQDISNISIRPINFPFGFEGGAYPGTTGNCPVGGILSPSVTCDIAIEIMPSGVSAGKFSVPFTVDFIENGESYAASANLSVELRDDGSLQTSNLDFGNIQISDTAKKVLILKNANMSQEISQLKVSATLPPSSWTISNPGKCEKINPNSICELDVEFNPKNLGDATKEIVITYILGGVNKSDSIKLIGAGEQADHVSIVGNIWTTIQVPFNDSAKISLTISKSVGGNPLENLALIGSRKKLNTSTCGAVLATGSSCTIDLDLGKFPKITNVNEKLTLSYKVGNKNKSVDFFLTGTVEPVIPNDKIDLAVTNFGQINVASGTNAKLRLNVKRSGSNSIKIKSIDNLPLGSSVSGSSTCINNKVLPSDTSSCVYDLEFGKINATKDIAHGVIIKYELTTANGAIIPKEDIFNLVVKFSPISEAIGIIGDDFGWLNVIKGGSTFFDVEITNSSSSDVSDLVVAGVANNDPISVHGSSTCQGKILKPLDSCKFVFEAKPTVSTSNYSKNLEIKFKINSTNGVKNFTIKGDFLVTNPMVNSQKPTIAGNNFGSKVLNKGESFYVNITVDNPATTDITIDEMERKNGWQSWIAIDNASTTCRKNGVLSQNKKCIYSIKITPDRAVLSHTSDMEFKYSNSSGDHDIQFKLQGKWDITAPQNRGLSPQNSAAPIVVYPEALASDDYFSYAKRPLLISQEAIDTYGQDLLNKIPGISFTGGNIKHVPWSFKAASNNVNYPLQSVVPDRIKDPVTGKSYVKLFHGTTSELKDLFSTGADAIAFNVAQNKALGQGFYLTTDPNEAKNYSCDRLIERRANDSGLQSIILVVGLEEDADVKGRVSHSDLSNNNGAPISINDYFNRNSIMHNQFVFFNNVADHLKIFEILVLPDGFGMADSYDDEDGRARTNTTTIAHCEAPELRLDGNNFGQKNVNNVGDSAKFTLKVTNDFAPPTDLHISSAITNISIDGLHDNGDILSIDRGSSTCISTNKLAKGKTCTFEFNIKSPISLDNYERPLVLKFKKDKAKAESVTLFPFTLKGKVAVGATQAANCDLSPGKWNYGTQKAGSVNDTLSPFIEGVTLPPCKYADTKLTDKILRSVFHVPDSNNKIAIFTMGAPGTGKSTAKADLLKKLGVNKDDIANIDPDELRGYLPDYRKYTLIRSPLCPKKYRSYTNATEACLDAGRDLRNAALQKAMDSKKNFIFDSPCAVSTYCRDLIKEAAQKGFTPYVLAVYSTKEQCVDRAMMRALVTGRYVSKEFVEEAYDNIDGNFSTLADEAIKSGGEGYIYDNSGISPILDFMKKNKNDTCNNKDSCSYFIK